MCRAAKCKQCGKATWKGCGMHVEQVLGGVPKSERCRCRESVGASAKAGATAAPGAGAPKRNWFGRKS